MSVTLGGAAVGIALALLELGLWWPGLNRLKKSWARELTHLAPLLACFCFGVLAILFAGGLLGGAAGLAMWGGNRLGDLALVVGVGGVSKDVQTGVPLGALSDGGMAALLILAACYVVMVKKSRWSGAHLFASTFSGIMMALNPWLAAHLAIPLASAVNVGGSWISG